MAVAVPNTRPLLSRSEIDHILQSLTQTPAQILGDAVLSPLPPKRERRSRLSYQAALAIARSYSLPATVLGENPLPSELPPKRARKRPLAAHDDHPDDARLKRRKKQPAFPSLSSTPLSNSNHSTSNAKKGDNRKLKAEPSAHKPLKVTVKLPKNTETSFRSISPAEQQQQQLPTKPKSEKPTKSSSKSRSKPARRDKDKLPLRSSPTPPPDLTELNSHNKRRVSPAPLSDAHDVRKGNTRLSFRSSPPPPSDVKDMRADVHRPKSTSLSPSSSEPTKPLLRSSPLRPSERKDAKKSSDRSRPKNSSLEFSESKDSDRRRLKSSPTKHSDSKDLKKETDKIKSHRTVSRQSDSNSTVPKSAKKPPASVPLTGAARVPRSEPVAFRSSSPDVVKKSESSKLVAVNRASSGKERRGEKNMSRKTEDSVERRRRDDKELPRKRRESSVDSAPPRSKVRDSAKRRSRTRDDALSDVDHPVSHVNEKERSSEKEYDRVSEREVIRAKGKEKERKALRDHRKSIDRDGEVEKSRRREERVHERDGYREKDKHRERDSFEKEREKYRDGERERERERLRSKVAEKPRERGLKRDLERGGDMEKERDRKTMRKELGPESDAAHRRSKEREDVLSSKAPQANPRGPLGFRSEPADKVLAKNNREAKNDASAPEKEKERTKDTTPRKSMLRFRSKPANAIKESSGSESKLEVPRSVKEAASPASMHSDPLPRPTNHPPTDEELRVSAKKLEQLGSEQRELLSQFDSLTKLCDDFLSKEKHDDFEETAKSAFNVLFRYCLKKETEMRLRKRTHREWMETRKETLTKYKYLARHFGPRITELEKLGRGRTARFLSHQVHKIYIRIFILQRCWNKEQRSTEGEMKSVMNYLNREGLSTDKNKVLTQRRTAYMANLVNDYVNIVCLFDAIVSDWTDGDDQAGFEMTMPF